MMIDGRSGEAVTRSRRGLAQVSLRAVIVVACPRSERTPRPTIPEPQRSPSCPVVPAPRPPTRSTGQDRTGAPQWRPRPLPGEVRRRRAGGLPWRATAVVTVLRRTPVGPSRVRPSPAPSSAPRWPRLPSPRRDTGGPSGTSSRSARAPATGRSTRATASAAACSSPRARGARSAATGLAHQASREEQIVVAERVLAQQGWGAWPACSRKLGLRGTPPKFKPAPQATAATPKKVTSTGWRATRSTVEGAATPSARSPRRTGRPWRRWCRLHELNPDLDEPEPHPRGPGPRCIRPRAEPALDSRRVAGSYPARISGGACRS